jgi:hypothetical protein
MRLIFSFVLCLLGLEQSYAQSPAEFIQFQIPNNYKSVTKSQKPKFEVQEFIPQSESLQNWTEMLTVQTFYEMKVAPKEFQMQLASSFKSACKSSAMYPVADSLETGYVASVAIHACEYADKRPQDEITLVKIIKGKNALYVVQKVFRFQPDPAIINQWTLYLKNIRICGTTSSDSGCLNSPDVKTNFSGASIMPIFGELFAYSIPPQFRLQAAQVKSNMYLRSSILRSDDDSAWTQRLLLTAYKDLAKQAGQTPLSVATAIAANFQRACPTTFFGKSLADGKTGMGHEMHVMFVSCGTHTQTNAKTATSESTMIFAIKGNLNFFALQWSERGAPIDKVLAPDLTVWRERMRLVGPILICDPVEGEAAPYPSCTAK